MFEGLFASRPPRTALLVFEPHTALTFPYLSIQFAPLPVNQKKFTKYDKTQNDDYLKQAAQQQLGGYGFASFCYILACILLIAAAAYISPLMCGSHYEQKMIRTPQNLDGGYASFEGDASRKL